MTGTQPDTAVLTAFEEILLEHADDENRIQRFLERNTAMLVMPHLLNHHLHLNALISKLPIGAWKTDLAYLTKSSDA